MDHAHTMLIDGQLVQGAHTLDVIDPAHGEVFASCGRADRAQLELAVDAARRACPCWASTPLAERAAILLEMADALEVDSQPMARLLTREQGKPLEAALGEVMASVMALRYFASLDLDPHVLREDGHSRIIEYRRPLGVVAAITPWNFPIALLAGKLGPALLAGNCVVAKPAPTTPLTTLRLGALWKDTLPAGVLNIIVGDNDLGALLTTHPAVAKVSFTGSTATGKKVMASAADTLKRLTLELGGNDAALVLEGTDPKVAARGIFAGAMVNSGQVCLAIKRAYVHVSLYEEICAELAALADAAIVDDGSKQGTEFGPIQNRSQFERVCKLLAEARAAGTVIAGGAPLDRPGYFVPPTIVRDLPDSASIVQEEQFGPILPVLSYVDLDDAITRINACDMGLGGSVWAPNSESGARVAMRLESGTVWVNKHLDMSFDIPFRGAKQSGIGAEYGRAGLEEFTQAAIVNIALQ